MKTTKLLPVIRNVLVVKYMARPEEPRKYAVAKGHDFEFEEFPGVKLFVYRDADMARWYVVEQSTGMRCGAGSEKTRAAVLASQYNAFAAMKGSKNGGGRADYVLELVNRCLSTTEKAPGYVEPVVAA